MVKRAALIFVQSLTLTAAVIPLTDLKPINVKIESTTYKGQPAVRVTEFAPNKGEAQALLPNQDFENGTIEVDLTGEPGPTAAPAARGFVGISFHASPDGAKYECFYIRPTNARADDQVRRNHSLQYISAPEYPWERLRKETPEKYESYADLIPGEWTKLKIEVHGGKAKLYVNGAQQPSLIVNDLKLGAAKGAIGLWLGPGTIAYFANLKITRD